VEVIEAIHARQSIGRVRQDPVPRDAIEKLLGAAVQAPNHYEVRPWRFVVLTGEGRNRLGDVLANALRQRFPDIEPSALEKERAKPLRAPVIIAVGVDLPLDPRVHETENICAVAAACQNILLAAVDLGLAVQWRTGEAARDADVKKFLGFSPAQHLLAFLYVGYPETLAGVRQRAGFEDRTVWMD
jgi:nitroreductase